MYDQPMTSILLVKKIFKIKRYGIIIIMFYSSEVLIQEYIYDFFYLLINETKVKEIINKCFNMRINRRISFNLIIDELINFINESSCFVNNKHELYKLYEYINNKEKMNLSQRKY